MNSKKKSVTQLFLIESPTFYLEKRVESHPPSTDFNQKDGML